MSAQRESKLPAWGAPGGQGLVLLHPKTPAWGCRQALLAQAGRCCLLASWGQGMVL